MPSLSLQPSGITSTNFHSNSGNELPISRPYVPGKLQNKVLIEPPYTPFQRTQPGTARPMTKVCLLLLCFFYAIGGK